MESLPDDVLHQILQIGTKARRLDHIDLCSLAIVNSHFDQLTQDSSLWATLLSRDFRTRSIQVPSKALYRELLEERREIVHQLKELQEANNEICLTIKQLIESLNDSASQLLHKATFLQEQFMSVPEVD